jgi:hypothetical protein
MDFGSLFFVIGLMLIVGVYLARPLIEHSAERVSAAEREMSALLARRDHILAQLADLEMDFEQGKLIQSHYQAQRQELLARGADVLRQIDALEEASPELKSVTVDDEIEAAVARLRGAKPSSDRFCHACGEEIVTGDRFCAKCGVELLKGGAQ